MYLFFFCDRVIVWELICGEMPIFSRCFDRIFWEKEKECVLKWEYDVGVGLMGDWLVEWALTGLEGEGALR